MGIFEYGNNWKELVKLVGTRNTSQARSHAQKFFTRLQKEGLEGVTDEICNVRNLHEMYKNKLNNQEIEKLYHLLTDIAYYSMEKGNNIEAGQDDSTVDDKSSSTIRINLKDSDYQISTFIFYYSSVRRYRR
jgi:hypothetical protein